MIQPVDVCEDGTPLWELGGDPQGYRSTQKEDGGSKEEILLQYKGFAECEWKDPLCLAPSEIYQLGKRVTADQVVSNLMGNPTTNEFASMVGDALSTHKNQTVKKMFPFYKSNNSNDNFETLMTFHLTKGQKRNLQRQRAEDKKNSS